MVTSAGTIIFSAPFDHSLCKDGRRVGWKSEPELGPDLFSEVPIDGAAGPLFSLPMATLKAPSTRETVSDFGTLVQGFGLGFKFRFESDLDFSLMLGLMFGAN